MFERADLNVPLDKATLEITDDTRIRAAVPTLQYLTSKGAKVMLTSHLVRALPQRALQQRPPYRVLRRARRERAARHVAAEARSRKQAARPPCAALRLCAVLRAAAGAAPPP